MRIKKSFFISVAVLLAILTLGARPSRAEDVLSVKTEGTARLSGGAEEARKAAVDQAMRNSVVEAASEIIKDEGIEDGANTTALEAEVYSKPLSYILNYKILSEGLTAKPLTDSPPQSAQGGEAPDAPALAPEELYSVWIEAVIDAAALRGAIAQATVSAGKGAYSNVSIVVLDAPDYETFRAVKAAVEKIPALKDVSYNSFSKGKAVLSARSALSAQSLAAKVAKEVDDRFSVFPADRSTVVIKMIPVDASTAR